MQHEVDYNEHEEEKLVELFFDDDPFQPLEILLGPGTDSKLVSFDDSNWADSCVVADSELPSETWVSLKEALLDSIPSFATCYDDNNDAGIGEDDAREEHHMVVDEVGNHEVEIVGVNRDYESRESIFRVWELRVVEEEDVFLTELKRAVAESVIREKQRLGGDETYIVDDDKLDELILSMGDLALDPLF